MRSPSRAAAFAFALLVMTAIAAAGGAGLPQPSAAARFSSYGHPGVFLLQRDGVAVATIHGGEIADTPRSPASTIKPLLALIALETGALRNADEVVPWNGDGRSVKPEWQKDMALREAMQTSSEPYFRVLAERIGRKRLAAWVAKVGYGNRVVGKLPARAWHDGTLTVTARQQLAFIDRLRRGDLPFSAKSIAAVKAAMRNDEANGTRIYGKTGTHLNADRTGNAWWIGWVEGPQGHASFTLGVDLKSMDDRAKRIVLGKQLLRDAGVLPAK
jgi:beta-lactamase class D